MAAGIISRAWIGQVVARPAPEPASEGVEDCTLATTPRAGEPDPSTPEVTERPIQRNTILHWYPRSTHILNAILQDQNLGIPGCDPDSYRCSTFPSNCSCHTRTQAAVTPESTDVQTQQSIGGSTRHRRAPPCRSEPSHCSTSRPLPRHRREDISPQASQTPNHFGKPSRSMIDSVGDAATFNC